MIKEIVLNILFPKLCINCRKEGKYICDKCRVFISETQNLYFKQEKYSLDGLTSIWEYEGIVKKLIQEIKYQGAFDIIRELIENVKIEIYYPYLTYVPMFPKKERKRGFNQAELIARELAKKNDCQVVSLLKKIKDTEDQTKLDKEQRLNNIKNTFQFFSPSPGLTRPGLVSQVVLVDDVFTTGATMRECAKVLKKAGIKKVWGFTLARTV